MSLLFIALGGSLGAVGRYILGLYIMKRLPNPTFPTAMLIVNTLGSFGLGYLIAFIYHDFLAYPFLEQAYSLMYLFLGIGFFGAFTTFSTFSVEAMLLVQKRYYAKLTAYVGLTILGSIIFFIIGYWIGRIF